MTGARRGFTMIELMTAIAIGLFILYVAFAGFRAASSAMQSSQRLAIGNAMLRACIYYSFNRADGISDMDMPDGPDAYPDSWPVPTVEVPWFAKARLRSCQTIEPAGARGLFWGNSGGPDASSEPSPGSWVGGPTCFKGAHGHDFYRLTPYGRDDPYATLVSMPLETYQYPAGTYVSKHYDVVFINDGDPLAAQQFNTSSGRKLTTTARRECSIELVDALTGRTTRLRFRITGATHKPNWDAME